MRIVMVFVGAAANLIAACGMIMPADAAPPTVVPSPGYDARLQEQRAAQHAGEPSERTIVPLPHRRHIGGHRRHKADRGPR